MTIIERREREREKRRQDIIDAAEKLFFAEGYETVTLDDIAAAAELSKGTVYIYFKNKMDLYFAISCRGLEIMIGLFSKAVEPSKTGLENIRTLGKAYYRFFTDHQNYFRTVMFWESLEIGHSMELPMCRTCIGLADKALNFAAKAVLTGVRDGSIRADIDPAKAAFVLWGQMTGTFQFIATKGKHFIEEPHAFFPFETVDQIVAYTFDMIDNSLRAKGETGK